MVTVIYGYEFLNFFKSNFWNILMTKISKGTLLKSSRNENVLFTFGYLNDRFFLILEPKEHVLIHISLVSFDGH